LERWRKPLVREEFSHDAGNPLGSEADTAKGGGPLSPTSHQTDIDRTLGRRDRDWVCEAVGRIEADFNRSSDTHLIKLELPCLEDVDLYLKDESPI
jgi:hypothetical protein